MLIPEKVRIGPVSYTIQRSHDAMTQYSRDSGKDLCGVARHAMLSILVDDDMPLDRERWVLLHEINHAITNTYGMDGMDAKSDEYSDLQATVWLSLLRDNPQLVSYLMEDSGE